MKKTYDELEVLQTQKSQEVRLPLFGILENIRSLYNVGSIFRTADGAGLSGLFLTGFTGAPPSKEIEKTALSATRFIDWKKYGSTAECLEDCRKGAVTIALEHTHQSIPYTELQIPPDKPIILVTGNEITGVEEETLRLCDLHTEIPMLGQKHSLNVSVAFGIVIFHLAHLINLR